MSSRRSTKLKNKKRKFKTILSVITFLILIICGIVWYGVYESYNNISVNNYFIDAKNINLDKKSTSQYKSPIKFVVISDLHDNAFGGNIDKLVLSIKNQDPNFIIADGDMLNNNSKDTDLMEAFLKKAVKIAPVYYALGNHELEYMIKDSDFINKVSSTGARVLENDYIDIVVKEARIRIGGMYGYADGTFDNADNPQNNTKAFLNDFENTTNYKIMMSHRPDSFIFGEASKKAHIDLVVSGHNHGGQIVIPFVGGVFGGDQGFFPKYVHGMYKKDNINILITSGLGSSHQKIPRFNNPPEVVVVNLY